MEKIRAETGHNVTISPISEYLASIAIIGPNSRLVLQELGKVGVTLFHLLIFVIRFFNYRLT